MHEQDQIRLIDCLGSSFLGRSWTGRPMMQADEDVKSPYKPDFSISETLIPVFAINSSYITPVKVNSNNVSWTEEEYDGSFIASSFEPSPNPQERQLARTRSTSKHRQKELILKEPFDDSLLFPIELVPKILCVGASCVDIILAMDEYPTEDKKHRCNESVICGGGNASNTAGKSTSLLCATYHLLSL